MRLLLTTPVYFSLFLPCHQPSQVKHHHQSTTRLLSAWCHYPLFFGLPGFPESVRVETVTGRSKKRIFYSPILRETHRLGSVNTTDRRGGGAASNGTLRQFRMYVDRIRNHGTYMLSQFLHRQQYQQQQHHHHHHFSLQIRLAVMEKETQKQKAKA